MDITPANMQIFFTGLASTYAQAYQSAPKFWDRIATLKPSGTEIEKDGWMGKIPTLRRWLGPRLIQNLAARSYTLENLPFELTLAIDKFKLQDDTHGIYTPMIQMMGSQSAKWPDYMLADKIRANSEILFDGVPYFDQNHPENIDNPDSAVYSNDYSLSLTPEHFATVYTSMATINGEDGKPLGITPNLLVVPPQLKLAALQILNGTFIAPQTFAGGQTQVGSNSNVLVGWADLLVVPELAADATTWYLLDTSKAIKPFVFQQRQAPVLTPRVDPTDPKVFDEHVFVYGVEARGNVGYTLPFLAARSTG